jgi:hypothetical protein
VDVLLHRRTVGGAFMEKAEFETAVQKSLLNTLRSLGEDSLESVLSTLGSGTSASADSLFSRLAELDVVLDAVFSKFSKIVKHITILQTCSLLKLEPPKLGNNLFWMVEELRSNLWKDRP